MNYNSSDYYAYGDLDNDLNSQTGQADWGYNAISNGGNSENTWRTLTNSEWGYVFNNRNTVSGIRYAKANVNGVNGVILFPDDWNGSYYAIVNHNSSTSSYGNNVISLAEWNNTFEAHGAVFLPAAGRRMSGGIGYVGNEGLYWSATHWSDSANALIFKENFCNPTTNSQRMYGVSIRLVQDD